MGPAQPRRAVTGEECIVAHPAGGHKRLPQQWEHDMPATKDEGTRTIEGFEKSDAR